MPNQPFYGLQVDDALRLRIFEDEPSGLLTPEAIATQFVREIRAVQPHGPYLLGGCCYGAYVAYEIAQQLRALGEEVPLALMLTARPWDFRRARGHYARRILHHTFSGNLSELFFRSLPVILKRKELYKYQLKQKLQGARPGLRQEASRKLRYQYTQKSYPGRITVIQTGRATESAWAELAEDGIDFHVMPSTHLSIFHEPNVQTLANILNTILEQVQP